ncbi:MAG TPA: VOC family protein [Flavobacteriales bacterium]|nr:VOC family protein [Flavobacteriales bacterium]
MQRRTFLTGLAGASIFTAMDGFSTLVNALAATQLQPASERFATFGAVHLNVTSVERAIGFWTRIGGMKVRSSGPERAELGSERHTLVVVHRSARIPYQEGFSGLYHVAVHARDAAEFAQMLQRVLDNKYPCSPIDHTMSQSVYMQDPDGITIEFTLETPERFKRVITTGGLRMEDVDGTVRPASASLDVQAVLRHLPATGSAGMLSDDAYIGHIHLYANNVERSDAFYKRLGFQQFNFMPEYRYADVGAGGPYQHRVAMNSWHGVNKPLAPADSAGLRHFHIVYTTKAKLEEALRNVGAHETTAEGHWVQYPTGNRVLLSHA